MLEREKRKLRIKFFVVNFFWSRGPEDTGHMKGEARNIIQNPIIEQWAMTKPLVGYWAGGY